MILVEHQQEAPSTVPPPNAEIGRPSMCYVCLDLNRRNKVVSSKVEIPVGNAAAAEESSGETEKPKLKRMSSAVFKKFRNSKHKIVDERQTASFLPCRELGATLANYHCSHKNSSMNLMFQHWDLAKMEAEFESHHLTHLLTGGGKKKPEKKKRLAGSWFAGAPATRGHKSDEDLTVGLAEEYGHEVCSTIMKNLKEHYTACKQLSDSRSPPKRTSSFLRRRAAAEAAAAAAAAAGATPPPQPTNEHLPVQASTWGQDIAMPFTYPLACAMNYAIQGKTNEVCEMFGTINDFWKSYAAEYKAKHPNGDDKELLTSYRYAIGWCGWFLYLTYYRMRAYNDLVFDKNKKDGEYVLGEDDRETVLDSIGVTGLQFMYCGFSCDHHTWVPPADGKNSSEATSTSKISKKSIDESEDDEQDSTGSGGRAHCCCSTCDLSSLRSLCSYVDDVLQEEVHKLLDVALLNHDASGFDNINLGSSKVQEPRRDTFCRIQEFTNM